MSTKHTPGPWSTGHGKAGQCRIYADSEMHAIARTYGPDLNGIGLCELTGPKNIADARLIAAAPDLLDALQSFPGFTDDAAIGDAWLEKMRAAIAKATEATNTQEK